MKTDSKIEITTFKPSEEFINLTKEHSKFIGQETVNMAYHLSIIESYLETEIIKPHLFIQIVKNFLSAISSQYPNKFHFEIAEKVLIMSQFKHNNDAVTLLAKSLCDELNKLENKLIFPDIFIKHKKLCEKETNKDAASFIFEFIECPDSLEEFESQFFEKTGLSIWDSKYLKLLRTLGDEGKKRAEEFKKALKGSWRKSLWFIKSKPAENIFFYQSPALLFLGCALWEDVVKRSWRFKEKQVPALTTSVQAPVSKMLTPKNKIIEKEKDIQIFHGGSLLGFVPISTIQQGIISTITNGVYKLNTVAGHRIVRFLVHSVFGKIISNDGDHRVLKFDRGASDLVELLGLSGHKAVTNIKEIVHAMAFFYFQDPLINGNLIQLKKYKSPITGRKDEGYLITVGTSLIPYQTFDAYKRGECGLLIPLLRDPPLVKPNQYHSAQYSLQMHLMAEFSKNSIQFFKEGAIYLPQEKRLECAHACGMPQDILAKVLDRWTQDGEDGTKFLERIEDDHFSLGSEYSSASEFLKKQGQIRINQSKRGTASVIKKKKAAQGKIIKRKGL